MSDDTETADDIHEPAHVLFKLESSSQLSSIVSALIFDKKDTSANVLFNEAGMRIVVEKLKSMQARAYLKKELLLEYYVNERVQITINLSLLHHCLTVFGDKSHLEMSYNGAGRPVIFM